MFRHCTMPNPATRDGIEDFNRLSVDSQRSGHKRKPQAIANIATRHYVLTSTKAPPHQKQSCATQEALVLGPIAGLRMKRQEEQPQRVGAELATQLGTLLSTYKWIIVVPDPSVRFHAGQEGLSIFGGAPSKQQTHMLLRKARDTWSTRDLPSESMLVAGHTITTERKSKGICFGWFPIGLCCLYL